MTGPISNLKVIIYNFEISFLIPKLVRMKGRRSRRSLLAGFVELLILIGVELAWQMLLLGVHQLPR